MKEYKKQISFFVEVNLVGFKIEEEFIFSLDLLMKEIPSL
jgi:hypothetical protein